MCPPPTHPFPLSFEADCSVDGEIFFAATPAQIAAYYGRRYKASAVSAQDGSYREQCMSAGDYARVKLHEAEALKRQRSAAGALERGIVVLSVWP